jgi:Rps23 Pro-64 3,4-dihydroxylase Tpa1-like proline 4-hydroxylase
MLTLCALSNKVNVFSEDTFLITNLIPLDKQQQIAKAYPCIPFKNFSLQKGNENVEKTFGYQFEFFSLEQMDKPYLAEMGWNSLFIDFIHQLVASPYIEALSDTIAMDLTNKKCMIEFTRYRAGDWLDAHYDKQTNKILTQLFYFNTNWHTSWGGYFEVLHPADITQTILSVPPLINYSLIVKPTANAWHKVTQVHSSALQDRVNMVLEFYEA